MGGRRSVGCVVAAGLLLTVACSTRIAPPVSQECEVDDDCAEGTLCDPFSTRCVAGDELPPRAHLAFDIRERGAGEILFRTEVLGCDQEVKDSESNLRALEIFRNQVSQSFLLFAYSTPTPVDVNAPTADEVITARLELRQSSRLGLPPSPIERAVQQAFTTDDIPTRTRVPWPRYHVLDDDRPPPFIVWETQPTIFGPIPAEGEPTEAAFAPMIQVLVPPDTYVPLDAQGETPVPCQVDTDCCEPRGDCNPGVNFCLTAIGECSLIGNPEFSAGFAYEPRCNREVTGTVERIDLETGTIEAPIAGASVRFRYADPTDPTDRDSPPLGVAPFGLSPNDECTSDAQCGDGRFCQPETGRCMLALAGRTADSSGSTTDDDGGFSTQLYNYCEDDPDGSPTRAYTATVTPSDGLPSVSYELDVAYGPPGLEERVPQSFCVPSWGDSVSMQLPLQGAPQPLVGDGGPGSYTCCDVGCLPAQAEDADPGPPGEPPACRGRTAAGATPSVRFEAPLLIDGAQNFAWLDANCVPLARPDEAGPVVVGSLRSDANCPADGDACVADGLAPGTAEEPRQYAVRIQSPTGSVLASRDTVVEVTADAEPLAPVTLPARVLVRGVVDVGPKVCELRSDPSDCDSRGAVVLAERIAMPGESTETVPGPYLHQVATYYDPLARRDGAFVLPLDPGGVYVMTALPAPGEDGGPAAFQIVDLRDPSTLTPRRFELEEGILVTMDLDTFDRRTFVIPLDTGSFLSEPLVHPGEDRPLDLNQVGECLTPALEGAQACKIRQLVPPGANISVSQVGLARFTARRAAGASDCANDAR